MWEASYVVKRKSGRFPISVVERDEIRLKIVVWLRWRPGLTAVRRRQFRVAIEGDANHRAVGRFLLEDAAHVLAVAQGSGDHAAALGRQVSDLDAADAEDGNGARICGVVGLGDELDRLTWLAELDLEAPARAALVGIVGADDGEGEGRAGHEQRERR